MYKCGEFLHKITQPMRSSSQHSDDSKVASLFSLIFNEDRFRRNQFSVPTIFGSNEMKLVSVKNKKKFDTDFFSKKNIGRIIFDLRSSC